MAGRFHAYEMRSVHQPVPMLYYRRSRRPYSDHAYWLELVVQDQLLLDLCFGVRIWLGPVCSLRSRKETVGCILQVASRQCCSHQVRVLCSKSSESCSSLYDGRWCFRRCTHVTLVLCCAIWAFLCCACLHA